MIYLKQQLLYSGKVKSLYQTNDSNLLITEFRDDTTAFDGVKHEKLPHKGMINNLINDHIMQALQAANIPTHHVEKLSANESLVKKLTMLPVECVIRNIAAGSLCRRLGIKSDQPLKPPIFELYLKNDELHDPLINTHHAIHFGWATHDQLDRMHALTMTINQVLSDMFAKAKLILVDAKFEFGLFEGEILLGDEISPDSCRIWDSVTHESLDKDRFRKDLGGVVSAYQKIAQRLGVNMTTTAC